MVSIFVKDKSLAKSMKRALTRPGLNKTKWTLNTWGEPVYIPLYFRANFVTNSGTHIPIRAEEYGYASNVAKKVELRFIASTDPEYFDGITNTLFPNRGKLAYAFMPGVLRLSLEYREDLFFGARNELGLRRRAGNCPLYKGTIEINLEPFSRDVTVEPIAGGYAFRMGFFSKKVSASIKAWEDTVEQ